MDKTLFEKGLEKRKATLGAEYVEKNLAAADDLPGRFRKP
jgi:4-carboxymuconolactone decarboxylase